MFLPRDYDLKYNMRFRLKSSHNLFFNIKIKSRYDNTGMFHWTPARAIEDCIIVSDLLKQN